MIKKREDMSDDEDKPQIRVNLVQDDSLEIIEREEMDRKKAEVAKQRISTMTTESDEEELVTT
jgi:hypothetical protein